MSTAPAAELMPAAFFGHGSPMNALADNKYTRTWEAFGRSCPKPRAILCISAHWYIYATAVTSMTSPPTIHDFYGFPDELFAVEYPAPGDPALGEEIADIVQPTWVGQDYDSWGIDHGTWSVLCHSFPDADVPVVQLAINALKPFEYHFDLGSRLAPLRERGVLIVGSGNVVHNLGGVDPSMVERGFAWAERFDEDVRSAMASDPAALRDLASHPELQRAAPTPDHLLPVLYFAGLAHAAGEPVDVPVDGYALGSLSMTAFAIRAAAPTAAEDRDGDETAGIPDPAIVPPDDTNL